MSNYKIITDLESLDLLGPAGLVWWRNEKHNGYWRQHEAEWSKDEDRHFSDWWKRRLGTKGYARIGTKFYSNWPTEWEEFAIRIEEE